MKHPETYLCTPTYGPRPAGKPDECFYCHARIGEEHRDTCVMRRKTVLVRMTVPVVLSVPEDWTEKDVLFHLLESSSCSAGNILRTEFGSDKHFCLCLYAGFEYSREATDTDEDLFWYSKRDLTKE